MDVLVGTPGRLAELLTDGCLRLDFCRAAVCDEVDVLLGEAWGAVRVGGRACSRGGLLHRMSLCYVVCFLGPPA